MTTLREVLDETLTHVLSNQREHYNFLSGSIDNAVTTFSMTEAYQFSLQARLSIWLEDVFVRALAGQTPASTITVIRGFRSSPKLAHSAGDLVTVNPIISDWEIFRAVNRELESLTGISTGLFRMKFKEFPFNASQYTYDLAGVSDFLDVHDVKWRMPGPELNWYNLKHDEWYLDQDASTDDFPSGKSLHITHAYSGQDIRVSYRASFSPFLTSDTSTQDVLTRTGLHTEAHDILAIGAAIRLISSREIKRNLTEKQADTRRAAEVPPQAVFQSIRGMLALREQRIAEEVTRLANRYPEQY